MIIVRPELVNDLNVGRWSLVYGRRKTGKTFLVSNHTDYDAFYFIKRDRTIISKKNWMTISYETMKELLRRDLDEGRTVVIDEFHRLGGDLLDELHMMEIKGYLFLISSTLHLSHQMISSSSPLLGKVNEVKVPLISFNDLLKGTEGSGKNYYEMLAFQKEPLVIAQDHVDYIDAIRGSVMTVPALVGEIFSEEDRKLSSTYEGIIRAISVGKQRSGEISSYIFSRGLIGKDDPSLIQQYLNNLKDIGILEKIRIFGNNRYVYKHLSPLVRAFYHLDERYNITDRHLTRKELKKLTIELIPLIMEDVIRDAITEATGTTVNIDHNPDGEVDGIFLRYKKPVAVIEVKWKKKITKAELGRVERKLRSHEVERKILVVPDRSNLQMEGIEIIEPEDIPMLEF